MWPPANSFMALNVLAMAAHLCGIADAFANQMPRLSDLSERERTFLNFVVQGQEAKALEYSQLAGINPNSIGGVPLSVWYFNWPSRMGGATVLRDATVQRLVFERFKQSANITGDRAASLDLFCNNAPVPIPLQAARHEAFTREAKLELRNKIFAVQKPHIDAMANSFDALSRYGLRDKAALNRIFKACFTGPVALHDYFYDKVLAKLIKAGADINAPVNERRRPIQLAVRELNISVTGRLLRDGASVDFRIPFACNGAAASTTVDAYQLQNINAYEPALVEMAAVLWRRGFSPLAKVSYPFGGRCVTKSLYDAAIDAGKLQLAKALKDIASLKPATTSAKPISQPAPSTAEKPADTNELTRIGPWRIAVLNGRLTAITKIDKPEGDELAGLWLQCMPGGRLEYVPIALKLFSKIQSLWVNDGGNVHEMRLVNERASGPSAVTLSKTFLAADAIAIRDGGGDRWVMEMSIHGENGPMSMIPMGGFSKMRAYMLANCKG